MNLEEFRKYKKRIREFIEATDNTISEEEEKRIIKEYSSIVQTLINSDLSAIPFEEWDGMYLALLDDDGTLDLSKTHANIDFKLAQFEAEKIDFRGCNLRNIEYFYYIDDGIYDEDFVKNNPRVFDYSGLSEDLVKKIKNHYVRFSDIDEHPEIIEHLLPISFASYCSDIKLVKLFGLDNAIRFYQENKEFIQEAFDGYSPWREFLDGLSSMENATYDKACLYLYDEIYNYITKVGYLNALTDELAPKEFVDAHPDVFLTDDYGYFFKEHYYNGYISLSDIRNNRDVFKNINYFRGTSNNSILNRIKDLDAYFKEFPPIIDKLLEYYYYNDDTVYNSNDEIKKDIPLIAQKLLDKGNSSFLPDTIRDFIMLKKYTGDVKIHINHHFATGPFLDDVDIDISILEEFEKNYPFFLDGGYYFKFSNYFAGYLQKENISSINSYDEFVGYVKNSLINTDIRSDANFFEFAEREGDALNKLLPDYFLTCSDYKKIYEIFDEKDKGGYSFGKHYLLKALQGYFDEYVSIANNYPQVEEYIKPKIKSFIFNDKQNTLKFIYDKVGFKKFLELLDLYGTKNINIICSNSNNFYDYTREVTADNVEEIFNKMIYSEIYSKHLIDIRTLPDSFKKTYGKCFLDDNAPEDLKEAFYFADSLSNAGTSKQAFSFKMFHDHPDWKPYLKKSLYLEKPPYAIQGFIDYLLKFYTMDEVYDLLFDYGHILYSACQNLYLRPADSKEEVYEMILNKVDELLTISPEFSALDLPIDFKNKYPKYYLPDNAPEELKDKFYSRSLTTYDLTTNPSYLAFFDNTILARGFKVEYAWVGQTFENDTVKQFKILAALEQIGDISLSYYLKDYIIKNKDTFDVDQIDLFVQLLSRLSYSNSSEIYNFRFNLASQLVNAENPLDSLEKIEGLFIRNNIPVVGKIFSTFNILHPNMQGFDFSNNSTISPELLRRGNKSREIVIFSDLIKCAAGSNNKSLKDYLTSLRVGNQLYEDVCNNVIKYDELDDASREILYVFYNHIYTLYLNTLVGKKTLFVPTDDIIFNISKLKFLLSPSQGMNYNLADRAVSMFCHFAGFDTVSQLEDFMNKKIEEATKKNIERSRSDTPLMISKGDFVKGIGRVEYLGRILQNGSVAKEFLGTSATSDMTPLDTDLSMVDKDCSVEDAISHSISSSYGPIWFVIKNDDRFVNTREYGKDATPSYDPSKYETFATGGSTHYGIRTGFASSDIDYIVVKDTLDERIPLEIVMNGFYIPVVNFKGETIFSYNDYEILKDKMQGLSYYGSTSYKFSPNLSNPDTLAIANEVERNNKVTKYKRLKIDKAISEVLKEFGLILKTKIDGDLTNSFAELIDTGSTSRGTNKIGEGDFDFMLRLDRNIISDPIKLGKLKDAFVRKFESYGAIDEKTTTGAGDFRFKGVTIEDVKVDIDISFTVKTDKITYSTDRCLQDRLETILKEDPIKYRFVCANIILAKKVLKEAGCYKSSHSVPAQGGLGGVGIENWILQNGGSFEDAARSFLSAAEGKSFSEFVDTYQIFDFGENHYSAKNGNYAHDNFVRNNMNESGYKLMIEALKNYLNRTNQETDEEEEVNSSGRKM